MPALGRYDPDLGMFVEEQPHQPSSAHLAFLRWLAEQGRLEHAVAGPPAGEAWIAVLVAPLAGRP